MSLIGMNGTNIVDCHEKFISALLLQLMRYDSTKKLSKFVCMKCEIEEKEIINK